MEDFILYAYAIVKQKDPKLNLLDLYDTREAADARVSEGEVVIPVKIDIL